MEINRDLEASNLIAAKKRIRKDVDRVISVDLSYKLFLIGRIKKNQRDIYRAGGAAISEAILLNSGVYIAPQECDSLIKEYACVLRSGVGYSLSLALATSLFFVINGESYLNGVIALLLLPFILSFYHEAIIFIKLLSFDPRKLIPPAVTDADALDTTAIIIASRNEPFAVAKMTFDSALALVYPSGKKEIIVVDNSDSSFKDYEAWKNYVCSFELNGSSQVDGVRVVFIHRDGIEGFKPRNLDIALGAVTANFVLYLDVDSTVLADTLLRITPMFLRDEKLGFVQLHTVPTNAKGKSTLALVQSLRNFFIRLETGFYTHTSHSLFYGHNAVWRTKVLREIGCSLEYHNDEVVVTEDLSMSLRASFLGYYGVGAWLQSGEWVPESMRETEAMWLRWTVGTYQVYAKHFTKMENLKKLNRREIFGWLQHIGVLINYGLLPVYVTLGLIINSNLLMSIVALSLLPEIIQGVIAYFKLSLGDMKSTKKAFKCYSAFLVLGAFINWVRCVGLWRYLTGKKQGWTPTRKSSEAKVALVRVILERSGLMMFGVACCLYSVYSLMNLTEHYLQSVLIAICGVYGLNCILAVFLFGASRMQEDAIAAVNQGDVKNFVGFYIKDSSIQSVGQSEV